MIKIKKKKILIINKIIEKKKKIKKQIMKKLKIKKTI